jgi:DNA-binding transcriptional ArsR family regulator
VVANARRLRVLQHICESGEACVSETARACRLPRCGTTLALRALQARGLLRARRDGAFVRYDARADVSVEHAARVLDALRRSFQRQDPAKQMIQAATAFTHVRRILIVQALVSGPAKAADLSVRCGISRPALYRHLGKLMRRGLVEETPGDVWQLRQPDGLFLQELQDLVCTGNFPAHGATAPGAPHKRAPAVAVPRPRHAPAHV